MTMMRRKTWKVVGLCVAGLLAAWGGLYAKHRQEYPFGFTHCCSKDITFRLIDWAETHGGKYPDAGNGAASLALLAFRGEEDMPTLAGKAIDPDEAKAYYRQHHTLSPALCSWEYVRGLTNEDPPDSIIVWDTTGLSHNGGRQKRMVHEVIRVDGSVTMMETEMLFRQLDKQRKWLEGR